MSCKLKFNLQITNNLKYRGVRNACWRDFINYNYVNIFDFLLMNNINNYRNVRRTMNPCCQIRCTMWLRPSSITFSNRIRPLSIELLMIFLSVYPMHMILQLKALRCLHVTFILVEYLFHDVPNRISNRLISQEFGDQFSFL